MRTLAVLALLLAPPVALAAERHDSSAPIDFAADHIELQDQENRALLVGNVKVTQAEMVLTAQRITVGYSGRVLNGSQIATRLDASGGVTVTRPDQSARAQYAVYDIPQRTIIMVGGVTLRQGGSVINGGRLTIDLDTGKAVIDGGVVGASRPPVPGIATAPTGRVTGRFTVPQRNK